MHTIKRACTPSKLMLHARAVAGNDGAGRTITLMLPYVMAIVALVLVARRAAYPQALMKPYRKGER
jgi:simple sugar transport system permease protein